CSGAGEEDGSEVIFFGVTLVQVISKSEVKREAAGNLPVVLNIRAVLQIPPVTEVAPEVGAIRTWGGSGVNNAWVGACKFFIWRINREGQRICKVVRRSGNVEFTILKVATQFVSYLDVVLAFGDRHHVRVRVDVFLKKLGVSVIRSETHFETVERD